MNRAMTDYETRPGQSGQPHSDQVHYVVWVLWLIGFSEQQIGRRVGLNKKQVAGVVGRSPYSNRSAMTDVERQQQYQELVAARTDDGGNTIDGGFLKSLPNQVLPLGPQQKKGAKA